MEMFYFHVLCSLYKENVKLFGIFSNIILKYSAFPPVIKYKLSGISVFTNQVTLQNKLLYIIADSDNGCNVSFLYCKYGYTFIIYYQCQLQNALYKMNQVDNCVHYIANGAVFKASLVKRKDWLQARWSYLGNFLRSVYVVVSIGFQPRVKYMLSLAWSSVAVMEASLILINLFN